MYQHHDHLSSRESEPRARFQQGTPVWVWDSAWLPAVVVHRALMDGLLVRLEHGVTFTAAIADVVSRDAASRGTDVPRFRPHPTHRN
jgi:hypothetical protein